MTNSRLILNVLFALYALINFTVQAATQSLVFSIGGSITGLTAATKITLLNNSSSSISSGNGNFVFHAGLANSATYNVTIKSQPANQNCWIQNGSGQITGANVSDILVNCVPITPASKKIHQTTYHQDVLRTGWNQHEVVLTPSRVKANFNLLHTVLLDEQIDAQPLLVSNQLIAADKKNHDIVYVVSENNSVYAIDANTGAVLISQLQLGSSATNLSPVLGPPVSEEVLPENCVNNSEQVGINSTPVIDHTSETLYVITYHYQNNAANYYLHALDLKTLQEKLPAQLVSGKAKLTGGNSISFNANVQRQRAALLHVNGNIYAGFASFCDEANDQSRGWLLGWNAKTLKPLPVSLLTNALTSKSSQCSFYFPCYLSSIWMSGFGPAADAQGNVYFITGNSDLNSYAPPTNLQESVVKVSANLTKIKGWFTPPNQATLDADDLDFGSGGVMLLPDQKGSHPRLAVAAGKDGNMFLLNRDALGGKSNTAYSSNLGAANSIGECWCGPSYFVGHDGISRIVSSGGTAPAVWELQTASKGKPVLTLQNTTFANVQSPNSTHDGGFFTMVSSNGTTKDSHIIWAVGRPGLDDPSQQLLVTLSAFDALNGNTLVNQLPAGYWPSTNANPNIVPLIANGHVFVASYRQLAIFGLGQPTNAQILTP